MRRQRPLAARPWPFRRPAFDALEDRRPPESLGLIATFGTLARAPAPAPATPQTTAAHAPPTAAPAPALPPAAPVPSAPARPAAAPSGLPSTGAAPGDSYFGGDLMQSAAGLGAGRPSEFSSNPVRY